MASWLQRYNRPKTQLTSQSQSQSIPSDTVAPGRTTYISTNTAEQKSFYADAPAGSQHAARLRMLALQQQPEYRPPKPNAANMLERKIQRSITVQGEPPGYNDGITSPAGPAKAGQQRSDTASGSPGRAAVGAASPTQHTYRSPNRQSRPKPMEVRRYEHSGTMAYHKKAAGGELLISAPVGSQEAKSMDDTAERLLATQDAYPNSYVSRKETGNQETKGGFDTNWEIDWRRRGATGCWAEVVGTR